jgi:hypothetical protein
MEASMSVHDRRGIPTTYEGVRFRSRIEAKWAAFFDLVEWPWTYEPLDLDGYIPDFVLGFSTPIAVEVKHVMGQAEFDELVHDRAKITASGWTGETLLLGATVGADRLGWLREGGTWDLAFPFLCLDCGRRSFAHASGSWRCRVTGCYLGNGHIDRSWDLEADFRAASNRVQWKAA